MLTLCRLSNRHLLLHLLPLVSVLISLSRLLASSHSQVISPLLDCSSILLSLGHLSPGSIQSLSSLANLQTQENSIDVYSHDDVSAAGIIRTYGQNMDTLHVGFSVQIFTCGHTCTPLKKAYT